MNFKSLDNRLDNLEKSKNCVTLPISDTQKDIMAQYNNERILNKHYKKYGELRQDGTGRYWCYIPTENGKKLIKKTYKKDIENKILSLDEYKDLKVIKNSFKDIYIDFIEYNKELDLGADNTTHRKITDYARFITNNKNNKYAKKIENSIINQIDVKDIERFISDCIKNLNPNKEKLTTRQFQDLWSLFNQLFEYAIRERLIEENYLKFIDKKKFSRQCVPPKCELEPNIIETTDLQKLLNVIQEKHLEKNKTIYDLYAEVKVYAVELIAYLGLRPAEVSALMWSNIHFEEENQGCYGYMVIQHSMKERNGEYVLEGTKTGKSRTIPIDEKVKNVLEGIKNLNKQIRRKYKDFLFVEFKDTKLRTISPKSIGQCLERLCKTAQIKQISPTTLRKSINTRLKLNGVADLVCSSMLGNSVKVNEKYYTYDRMCTKSDKMNGLKLANSDL